MITDRNLSGTRSVTNDIEGVVRDLIECGVDLKRRRIIYRDSNGRWDGIATRGDGFAGFVPLGARSEEAAIVFAQARGVWEN